MHTRHGLGFTSPVDSGRGESATVKARKAARGRKIDSFMTNIAFRYDMI